MELLTQIIVHNAYAQKDLEELCAINVILITILAVVVQHFWYKLCATGCEMKLQHLIFLRFNNIFSTNLFRIQQITITTTRFIQNVRLLHPCRPSVASESCPRSFQGDFVPCLLQSSLQGSTFGWGFEHAFSPRMLHTE